jgi:hypothetical protein
VVGVGNIEAVARGVGQYLAGEEQGRVGQALLFQAQRQRRAVDLRVELLHHFAEGEVEEVVNALARVVAHDVAARVDEHERGPRLRPVLAPHLEIHVVDHRMRQLVALDDAADVFRVALVVELGRVHADDHQLLRVLLLQPLQLWDDVEAVDATVRPEVEQHDLAAQVGQRQRPFHVEPVQPGRELRRGHVPGKGTGGRGPGRRLARRGCLLPRR